MGVARSRRHPLPEIVLWIAASRSPSESQTPECSDLLSRSRATFVIVAQRQPGKLLYSVADSFCLACACLQCRCRRFIVKSRTTPQHFVDPCCRQRPYCVEYTRSHPNSEVKRRKARSVLGWGTAWEVLRVPLAFFFLLGASFECLIINGWESCYPELRRGHWSALKRAVPPLCTLDDFPCSVASLRRFSSP